MKKICIVVLCLLVAASCLMIACAKDEEIVGGYTEQRELTEADQTLFDEVMASQDTQKQYEPVSVATQVVAGTNYCFKTNVTENGSTYEAYIYIYEPLPNSGELPEFVKEEKI